MGHMNTGKSGFIKICYVCDDKNNLEEFKYIQIKVTLTLPKLTGETYDFFRFSGKNITLCILFVCLFVFVALRPMSTAMVIAGRSVHLTTLFPGQA